MYLVCWDATLPCYKATAQEGRLLQVKTVSPHALLTFYKAQTCRQVSLWQLLY